MFFLQVAGFFFLFAAVLATVGPKADLYIGNKFVQPDGFNRSAVLVGQAPDLLQVSAPVILAKKGDTFRMNVINQLTDPTMEMTASIHWHGIVQEGSNWADGPVGVAQCPIVPGQSFLYQFDVPDQAGTFWYHSHDATQYCDGLRGVLIVRDPDDPYKYMYDFDNESTIITLADWFHAPSPQQPTNKLPIPDSILINGQGRFSGGPLSPLAVVSVMSQKRYRFRLISIACVPNYVFSIDGHDMTIIEVDGNNVEPLLVDSIQIFTGQRYSFILTANQPISNYWIRASPNVGTAGFEGGINSAILRYIDAPAIDPTTQEVASTNPMLETNLHPLSTPDTPSVPGIPIPGYADINLNLNVEYNQTSSEFAINNASFTSASVPVLLQILNGARTAQELLPSGSVYTLPPNKVIEVSLPGGSIGSPHPFHLHGHAFHVIRSAGSSVYNFENPVQRDVVNIGSAGDNMTFRFVTDNSGPWILHCHIDFHLANGLAIVFAEDAPAIANSHPPDTWDELCPTYDTYLTHQNGP